MGPLSCGGSSSQNGPHDEAPSDASNPEAPFEEPAENPSTPNEQEELDPEEETPEEENTGEETEEETPEEEEEEPAPIYSIPATSSILTALADRLLEVQNNDGSYDWRISLGQALTPETTGAQNVTGITAWGLIEFQTLMDSPSYQASLDETANYLETRLDLLLANPSNANHVSCPNWTYLSWYLSIAPDAALQDKTTAAFELLVETRDDEFGDDDLMRGDGILNRVIQGRAATPGIIPWDLALCVEAFGAMADLNPAFDGDYQDTLDLLDGYLNETYFPAYDANPALDSAPFSLAHSLFVLVEGGEVSDTVAGLSSRLTAMIQPDGRITNAGDGDSALASSAYGLLAIKILESDRAAATQAYLESMVEEDGAVVNPNTGYEIFEVEGEILRALSYKASLF